MIFWFFVKIEQLQQNLNKSNIFNICMEKKRIKKEIHPVFKTKLTFGQKASDKITNFCGSWAFIFITFIIIFIWVTLNIYAFINRWDPYPFILLNLILSCLAAIQAPIILMSQNRLVQRERIIQKYDYLVNVKAEHEIQDMQKDLEEIKRLIKKR